MSLSLSDKSRPLRPRDRQQPSSLSLLPASNLASWLVSPIHSIFSLPLPPCCKPPDPRSALGTPESASASSSSIFSSISLFLTSADLRTQAAEPFAVARSSPRSTSQWTAQSHPPSTSMWANASKSGWMSSMPPACGTRWRRPPHHSPPSRRPPPWPPQPQPRPPSLFRHSPHFRPRLAAKPSQGFAETRNGRQLVLHPPPPCSRALTRHASARPRHRHSSSTSMRAHSVIPSQPGWEAVPSTTRNSTSSSPHPKSRTTSTRVSAGCHTRRAK